MSVFFVPTVERDERTVLVIATLDHWQKFYSHQAVKDQSTRLFP